MRGKHSRKGHGEKRSGDYQSPQVNNIDYSIYNDDPIVGTFIGNDKGFGFVEVQEREEDIFIPASDAFGAMDGDEVVVLLRKKRSKTEEDDSPKPFSTKKREEGIVYKISKRNTTEVIGTFYKSNGFGFVVADNRKISQDIYIPKQLRRDAKNEDKVVVVITKYPENGKKAEGKITEVLGKSNDATIDLMTILKEYGYKLDFPKEVKQEAKELPQVVLNFEDRVDLRNKEIFTIDGSDTKDIDDAVSLEYSQNKYKLGVHIADVSSYVLEGSEINKEALKRGTSVYLIDTVIPMLPKELSNGICSLNEGEDRYALSCEIVLDNNVDVISFKVFKSVINSKKKMTYDDVYKTLCSVANKKKAEIPEGYEVYSKTLIKMKELAEKLIQKRHNLGMIDFDIPEPKILLREDGKPEEIKPYEITIANRMIEMFMVLANECVAEKFCREKIPFIYRVHDNPSLEKITRLKVFLKNLNYPEILDDDVKPIDVQKAMSYFDGTESEKVVHMMGLRAMELAKYSNQNDGHFGLALKNYCHFTSPIRRYPDLFIHRMISKYLVGGFSGKEKSKYENQAANYSEMSSMMERRSEEAERDLNEIKMCEYMEEHIGEEYDGVISGVTNYGIYVELDNTIEGLIHVENMKEDYYNYDEERCQMVGERKHKIYKMGDYCRVRVLSANKILRRIEFEII